MATNQMRREAAKRKLERQRERRAQQAKRRRTVAMITSATVVVVVVVGVVLLTTLGGSGGDGSTDAAQPTGVQPTGAPVTPGQIPTAIAAVPARPTALAAAVPCAYPAGETPAKPVQPPAAGDVSATGTAAVTLRTSAGAIPLTLERALAPCAVNSFLSLTRQGYFDGTGCHRLTTSPGLQVLQCGDPSGTGSGGPGYSFADEVFPELTYGRGLLAMANGGPDTNGSQFFMIYGEAQLPPNYTVFGSIGPDGLTVLDTIAKAGHDGSLDPSPGGGKPATPVTIEKATAA